MGVEVAETAGAGGQWANTERMGGKVGVGRAGDEVRGQGREGCLGGHKLHHLLDTLSSK
jgi:hypothetical protein